MDWPYRTLIGRDVHENTMEGLRETQARLGNEVVDDYEGVSGAGAIATEYGQLFGAVAESVIEYQFFAGNRLPPKKRKDSFGWGIGSDVGKLTSLILEGVRQA